MISLTILAAEGLAQLGCGLGAGIATIGAGLGIGKIGAPWTLSLVSQRLLARSRPT